MKVLNVLNLFAAALVAASTGAWSQAGPSAALSPSDTASAAAVAGMSEGEVRKVDKAEGKLTLRHGPLRNLGMPAMTMVFRVRDPMMLDGLREGDKVRFTADKVDGVITVMQLEPAR